MGNGFGSLRPRDCRDSLLHAASWRSVASGAGGWDTNIIDAALLRSDPTETQAIEKLLKENPAARESWVKRQL